MKIGFVFNELGVMLEDEGKGEAAYEAYERATQIDPKNISATINAYSLAFKKHIHSDSLEKLKKKMSAAMSGHDKRILGIMGVLQNYGTIRDPSFYQQQSAIWSAIGPRRIAADRLQKALALSEQVGASALVQKAMVCAYAGDIQKAESWFLAALAEDGANELAFSGLCTLMLNRRNTGEAEKWLHKAQAAGVEKDALLFQTITLAILKKETDQALKLLESATEKYPDDLRYWALLADILLNRGDIASVEFTVLPKMKQRLKKPDHFLVQAIQGLMLCKKGPSRFKEARLSLLNAVSINASLPEIWTAVFELDVALGNLEFTEADAKSLLRVDSGHAQANYLMGVCLLARREVAAAEDFFQRSIEKQPTAAAHNDLAECLRLQKRLADAEASARRALELNPDLYAAQDTLACVFCDEKRYAEAEAVASRAVNAKPTCMAFQLTMLRAEVGLRKKGPAEERLKMLDRVKFAVPETLRREIDVLK
jgi:tetratricopeptide (TPR) repeat protein